MRVLLTVYSLYAGLLFLLCCAVQVPFQYLFRLFPRRRVALFFRLNHWVFSVWAVCCGMRVTVRDRQLRDIRKTYMLVGNHCNLLDMPVCAIAFTHPARTLAKAEFARIPIIGMLMRGFCILIKRESADSRQAGARALLQAMQEGQTVLVFPEGTRNRTPEMLQPFKDGAFRAAIAAQVPVMPFVQINMRCGQRPNSLLLRPAKLVFRYLPEIPTLGMTDDDVPRLRDAARAAIEQVLLAEDVYFSATQHHTSALGNKTGRPSA